MPSGREGLTWRWTLLATLLLGGWWMRPMPPRYDVQNCRFYDNPPPALTPEKRQERLDSLMAGPRDEWFRLDSILLSPPPRDDERRYRALWECLRVDLRTGEISTTYWLLTDDDRVEVGTRP